MRLIYLLMFLSLTSLAFSQEAASSSTSPVSTVSVESNRAELTALRDVMDKHVETQKVLSEEKNDWKLGKEILLQRIALVSQELGDLKTKKTESEKSITDSDLKKAELVKNKLALEVSLKQLQDEIVRYEGAIRPLKAWLPPAVLEKVDPLYQRIPEPDTVSKVSLAERYQNVIGILNQVNKSNGEITIVSEIRTLSDAKPAEVKTLYVGLAQGYYVNATGKRGGYGHPTAKGWEWKQDDTIASNIQTAIDTLEAKTKAHFVSVPVQLKN